jgi:hypothetical protein
MYICVCVYQRLSVYIYTWYLSTLLQKLALNIYVQCTCMKGKFYADYSEKIKSTLPLKIFLTILPYFTFILNIVSTEQGRYWYTYVQHMYSIYMYCREEGSILHCFEVWPSL